MHTLQTISESLGGRGSRNSSSTMGGWTIPGETSIQEKGEFPGEKERF
jgi:hypothetical protein